MGLKVLLYDPNGEIAHFLSDIFEVTGHMLYTASSEEEVIEHLKEEPDFFMLPYSSKEVWVKSLEHRPTIPLFFVFSEEEESKARETGIPEINLVKVPFNPLDLFERLGFLYKSGPNDYAEIGPFNAFIKSHLKEKGVRIKLKTQSAECTVNTYPLSLSCDLDEFKKLLRESYELEEGEDLEEKVSFKNLKDFFEKLLEEEKPEEKRKSVGVVEKGELVRTVSKEYKKGIFKKNFYLIGESNITLVNLSSADTLVFINKALVEEGKSIKDVKLVLFTDFEPASVEAVRRILAVNQNVGFIGRKFIKETFEKFGLRNVRFRAIEEIPSLEFRLPEGGNVKILPFRNSSLESSAGYYLEEKKILFTGKFLGSFGGIKNTFEIFHKVFFPCRNTVEYNLGLLENFEDEFEVMPFYGEKRKTILKELKEMFSYNVNASFLEREVIIGLVNGVLLNLNEEERENLLGSIGYLAEVDEKVVVDFYTEPNLFYEEFVNSLTDALENKEKFYDIMDKLLEYNFYVPLRSV